LPLPVIKDFLAKILPGVELPEQLVEFVAQMSGGNPRYVIEAIEQLQKGGSIELQKDELGSRMCVAENLEEVDVTKWKGTAMISDVVALLEALEPLELVICKMATIFDGPFTVEDLAASWQPMWAPSTRILDQLRILVACNRLVRNGILVPSEPNAEFVRNPELRDEDDPRELLFQSGNDRIRSTTTLGSAPKIAGPFTGSEVTQELPSLAPMIGGSAAVRASSADNGWAEEPLPEEDEEEKLEDPYNQRFTNLNFDEDSNVLSCFILADYLIRKIAGAMILEKQKIQVKRQALMQRAIKYQLPGRLEMLKKKTADRQSNPVYYYDLLQM
jgi:hypothetical protein